MEINIPLGTTFRSEQKVEEKHTASEYGSGLAKVFSTPALVALMENAAYRNLEPFLPEGFSSVGTEICVKHQKATLPGDTVYAISKIVEVDRRRIEFEIEAYDSKGLIGQGKHQRFIIETQKFMAKLAEQ
ncbi:MAG TPA: thioesterase family protein [Salinivirgaceae bacterium]|nr:thioesterase family protein [Salinivirgaceae bacterium]